MISSICVTPVVLGFLPLLEWIAYQEIMCYMVGSHFIKFLTFILKTADDNDVKEVLYQR